jgi:hypothetical protein
LKQFHEPFAKQADTFKGLTGQDKKDAIAQACVKWAEANTDTASSVGLKKFMELHAHERCDECDVKPRKDSA